MTRLIYILAVLFVVSCAAPQHHSEESRQHTTVFSPTSISVGVWGDVQHPQQYSFPAGIRLADAIARAGGVTEWAARKAVTIRRKDGTLWRYNLLHPGRKDYGGNASLRDGDLVYVPRLLS